MTPEQFVDIFRDALYLVLIMVAAIMIPGLVVGLVISILQAATSINEQTLSFLPRLLVTIVTLMVLSHWLVGRMMDFFRHIIDAIPQVLS
ncbi:flagellar biosynthesis protein FliQ [Gallaecimonas sp. GXIMD4217]|uniref:flagellar biosynthesis protein FliQ n=1 Tax=Gallaecimonas sp. GXIMD4217 TaxID=3131927 RepID=UPI00311AC1B9